MKNVTFSLDENLLKRAKEKAMRERTSLNELFKKWLEGWIRQENKSEEYQQLMDRLGKVCEAGKTFSREELNER